MFSTLGLESALLLLPSWQEGAAMVTVMEAGRRLVYKLCGIAKSNYSSQSDLIRRITELENIVNQLRKNQVTINILSANIIYTNCKAVQNSDRRCQHYLRDLTKAKQYLVPLQKGRKGLSQNVISSLITSSPTELIKVIKRNPKELLSNIEEESNATFKPQEDYVIPFWFQDKGIVYKGWVKRGLLDVFGCKYNELWLPTRLPTRFTYNLPTGTSPRDRRSRHRRSTYHVPSRSDASISSRYRRLADHLSSTSTVDISPKKSMSNLTVPSDQVRYSRKLNTQKLNNHSQIDLDWAKHCLDKLHKRSKD